MTKALEHLPDILKEERERRNLSQEQASVLMGVSKKAYGSYEERRAEPSIDSLMNLAAGYGYECFSHFLNKDYHGKLVKVSCYIAAYTNASPKKREIVDYILGLKK